MSGAELLQEPEEGTEERGQLRQRDWAIQKGNRSREVLFPVLFPSLNHNSRVFYFRVLGNLLVRVPSYLRSGLPM